MRFVTRLSLAIGRSSTTPRVMVLFQNNGGSVDKTCDQGPDHRPG
jgi:hypothetical protein